MAENIDPGTLLTQDRLQESRKVDEVLKFHRKRNLNLKILLRFAESNLLDELYSTSDKSKDFSRPHRSLCLLRQKYLDAKIELNTKLIQSSEEEKVAVRPFDIDAPKRIEDSRTSEGREYLEKAIQAEAHGKAVKILKCLGELEEEEEEHLNEASLDLILERVTDILAYIDLQEKSLYSNCDTENGKENCPEFLKDKKFETALKTLNEASSISDKLATRHRLELGSKHDEATSAYAGVKNKTLQLKVKCLAAEIKQSTYGDKSHLKALHELKRQFDSQISESDYEINKYQANLSQYQILGEDFDETVQEFTKLRANIEEKKWAIMNLRNNS